jgi:hypothetical protein
MCTACKAGMFQALNETFCTPCSAGRFSSFDGLKFCDFCAAGKTSLENSSLCTSCPMGRISNSSGASVCFDCPLGRVSSSPGASICTSCIAGRYSDSETIARIAQLEQSTCIRCPLNSITPTDQSVYPEVCSCPQGFYGKPSRGQNSCRCKNLAGTSCPPNSIIPFVSPGFYRAADIESVYECIPSSSCQSTGYSLSTICAEGYTGTLCGDCVKGTHYKFGINCKRCPDPVQKYLGLVVVIIFVVTASYVLMFRKGSQGLPPQIKYALYGIQLLGIFPNLSSSWPSILATFLSGLSLINLDIDLFAPGKLSSCL